MTEECSVIVKEEYILQPDPYENQPIPIILDIKSLTDENRKDLSLENNILTEQCQNQLLVPNLMKSCDSPPNQNGFEFSEQFLATSVHNSLEENKDQPDESSKLIETQNLFVQNSILRSLRRRKHHINWYDFLRGKKDKTKTENTSTQVQDELKIKTENDMPTSPFLEKLFQNDFTTNAHSLLTIRHSQQNRDQTITKKRNVKFRNSSPLKGKDRAQAKLKTESTVSVLKRRKIYLLKKIKNNIEIKMTELRELKASLGILNILNKSKFSKKKKRRKLEYLRLFELPKTIKMLITQLRKQEKSLESIHNMQKTSLRNTETPVVQKLVQKSRDKDLEKQMKKEGRVDNIRQHISTCSENGDVLNKSEINNSLTSNAIRSSLRERKYKINYANKKENKSSNDYQAELETLVTFFVGKKSKNKFVLSTENSDAFALEGTKDNDVSSQSPHQYKNKRSQIADNESLQPQKRYNEQAELFCGKSIQRNHVLQKSKMHQLTTSENTSFNSPSKDIVVTEATDQIASSNQNKTRSSLRIENQKTVNSLINRTKNTNEENLSRYNILKLKYKTANIIQNQSKNRCHRSKNFIDKSNLKERDMHNFTDYHKFKKIEAARNLMSRDSPNANYDEKRKHRSCKKYVSLSNKATNKNITKAKIKEQINKQHVRVHFSETTESPQYCNQKHSMDESAELSEKRRKLYLVQKIKNNIEIKMTELRQLKASMGIMNIPDESKLWKKKPLRLTRDKWVERKRQQRRREYFRLFELTKAIKLLITELRKQEISMESTHNMQKTFLRLTETSAGEKIVQQSHDKDLEKQMKKEGNVCNIGLHISTSAENEGVLNKSEKNCSLNNSPNAIQSSLRERKYKINYKRCANKKENKCSTDYETELETLVTSGKSFQRKNVLQATGEHNPPISQSISFNYENRDISLAKAAEPIVSLIQNEPRSSQIIKRLKTGLENNVVNKDKKTNEEKLSRLKLLEYKSKTENIFQQQCQNQSRLTEKVLDKFNLNEMEANNRTDQHNFKAIKAPGIFKKRDSIVANFNRMNTHRSYEKDFSHLNNFQSKNEKNVSEQYKQQFVPPVASNVFQPVLEANINISDSESTSDINMIVPDQQLKQSGVEIKDEFLHNSEIMETIERNNISLLEQSNISNYAVEDPLCTETIPPVEEYQVQSILRAAEQTIIRQSGQNLRIVQVIKVKYQ